MAARNSPIPNSWGKNFQFTLDAITSETHSAPVEVGLLQLLLGIQQQILSNPPTPAAPIDLPAAESLIRQAETYIRRELGSSLDLARIAQACHCSASHLSRLCRQQRQCSLLDLVVTERMRQARDLLLQEQYTILSVALRVGYGTASHFGKIFKRYHGMTPKHFVPAVAGLGGNVILMMAAPCLFESLTTMLEYWWRCLPTALLY